MAVKKVLFGETPAKEPILTTEYLHRDSERKRDGSFLRSSMDTWLLTRTER